VPSARLPEGGLNDLGDVWMVNTPTETVNPPVVAVAWKRLTGTSSRRTPDGVRDVVVVSTDDFLHLVAVAAATFYALSVIVECKATQTLSVTRPLPKASVKAGGTK